MNLSQIGQIALTVKDLERAIGFYRDVLGVPFLFQVPNMAFFNCDGIRLMLGLAEKAVGESNSYVYFRVGDIQAAHRELQQRGASFVGEPHFVAPLERSDLWLAFLKDGEGNTLALMSEVPR